MDIQKLINDLERDEGFRSKVYLDSKGIPTIGIGRNLRDRGITKAEGYYLLHNDIEAVTTDLDGALAWWRQLDEVRQRVLFNMCFNMGIKELLQFKVTLNHIYNSKWDEAADAMLHSVWALQVGIRATRLAEMMRKGEDYVANAA